MAIKLIEVFLKNLIWNDENFKKFGYLDETDLVSLVHGSSAKCLLISKQLIEKMQPKF
jgi:hypothetical protein